MRPFTRFLFLVAMTALPFTARAAAPDLLPPLGMLVDAGNAVTATGADFIDHPLSGSVNFSPNNYDVQLAGNIILPVQDVVAYNGITRSFADCQDYANTMANIFDSTFQFYKDDLAKEILGLATDMFIPADAEKVYHTLFMNCTTKVPAEQEALLAGKAFPRQVLADVRNTGAGATDVVFSGQAVDPYMAGFPWTAGQTGAALDFDTDVGTDGFVIGAGVPFMTGIASADSPFNSSLMTASLSLFRLAPNASGKKVMQWNSFSSGWLDRPLADVAGKVTNPACFTASKSPKYPAVPKTNAELLAAGCVGEKEVVAIVTPHLYTNTNAALEAQGKSRDMVAVSRSQMDSKTPQSKIGYLTIYRRTATIPDDKSIFQNLWQFEKSVTHSQFGIPEPYGAAVIQNDDPKTGKVTEGVVVGANKAIGNRYYVFYYHSGMTAPREILVGGLGPNQIGVGGFGPYRVYSTDVNKDHCGDILLTRARISPDGKTIDFADYVDVHFQDKMPTGECRETFDASETKYTIPPVQPQTNPRISSLAIADFNRDGHDDLMVADFTTYLDKGNRENYAHFLEYKGGIYNNMLPPHFVVNTKSHGEEVGPVDIKADRDANLAVVSGTPMMFAEVPVHSPVAVISNPCEGDKVQPFCQCTRDMDNDGFGDIDPNIKTIIVKDCQGNDIIFKADLTLQTLTDCKTGQQATHTGREWYILWAGCDNCGLTTAEVCNGPEQGAPPGVGKCWNKSQTDSDGNGYGDICEQNPCPVPGPTCQPVNPPQSSLYKSFPLANAKPHLREDRVVYIEEQPVIARREELKLVAFPGPSENGHEVTVLLNKTNVSTKKKECTNGDLACICEQTPDLLACKCLQDPKLSECIVTPASAPTCTVDVCRGDLTAPFPRMCDYIRPFNDEIRVCTGLNSDFLIPVEGVQYHISCTMPNTPALDLGAGLAYTRVYKTGQMPKNYFKDWHKPVADDNVLPKPVLLNPPTKGPDGADLDLSPLPTPAFDADVLPAVLPDVALNQAPGITQIDNIMQIQTNLVDMGTIAAGAGKQVPKQAAAKVLSLDVKGYSSPPGCQWKGPDCPRPMPNPPSARDFVTAICARAEEVKATGKPVTMDTVNEAFGGMSIPAFLHQKIVSPTTSGSYVVPLQFTTVGMVAEGGCGCTFSSVASLRTTVVPLLMAAFAVGGMMMFRRKQVNPSTHRFGNRCSLRGKKR